MNSLLGNTRRKDISFHSDGRIDLSAHLAQMLRLERGDVIDIMDCNRELYLYIRHRAPVVGKHEATCFPTKQGCMNFRAWSKRLCLAMMERSGATGKRLDLAVGLPETLADIEIAIPIIYKNMLNNDKGNQVQRILGQPVRL